eukprot:SAG31_NODE_28430_length_410_cov_0.993569_2_plen_70_part_01
MVSLAHLRCRGDCCTNNYSRRHEAELDFRREAANLAECKANLVKRGFEPRLARIPAVIVNSPTVLATQHV